jgi:hypothetical protein
MTSNISEIRNRDFIRIKRHRHGARIECVATTITFKDKDTQHIVIYLPSLELSGYGETSEVAKEMLDFQINEFLGYLVKLSYKDTKEELTAL